MKKNLFKKIGCMAMSAAMIFGMSLTASAQETETPGYSVTVNEYDMYVNARKATSEELARNGVGYDAVEVIQSNAIEDELTRRSALSTEELSQLGYNAEQIEILQNYTGERIETNPELRGTFADMTCNFYQWSANNISLAIRVDWEWSNAPVLTMTDIVGIRWQGTNPLGHSMNLALNSSGSSCKISYYNQAGEYRSQKSASISTDDPYGHAYAKFEMGAGIGDQNELKNHYAKAGRLIVKVDRTGSDVIKEAAFVFGYGHSTFTFDPSLSIPAGFSIGFSGGVETMCTEAIRMDSNGVITKY